MVISQVPAHEVMPGFKDTSDELVRIYHYPNGEMFVIEHPTQLRVSASGNHRVVDATGRSYIVAPGWRVIEFKTREGAKPFSF